MPIRACPDCGSDRLAWPTGKAGPGLAPAGYTCWDCKWQGAPLEFATFGAWQAFRATGPRVLHAP